MQLVAVVGASPGIGKSLLCTSLATWLSGEGWAVDHFEEEHVLTRPAFAQLAADFTTTGTVGPDVFVDTTVRYLTDAEATNIDVVVMDSLLPFVPSLLAFGHSEDDIDTIVDGLAERIATIPTLVVFLDGDATLGLQSQPIAGPGMVWDRGGSQVNIHQPGIVEVIATFIGNPVRTDGSLV